MEVNGDSTKGVKGSEPNNSRRANDVSYKSWDRARRGWASKAEKLSGSEVKNQSFSS